MPNWLPGQCASRAVPIVVEDLEAKSRHDLAPAASQRPFLSLASSSIIRQSILDEPGKGDEGVGHALGSSFVAGFRTKMPEREAGVRDDGRQHGQKQVVPGGNGLARTILLCNRNHGTTSSEVGPSPVRGRRVLGNTPPPHRARASRERPGSPPGRQRNGRCKRFQSGRR